MTTYYQDCKRYREAWVIGVGKGRQLRKQELHYCTNEKVGKLTYIPIIAEEALTYFNCHDCPWFEK